MLQYQSFCLTIDPLKFGHSMVLWTDLTKGRIHSKKKGHPKILTFSQLFIQICNKIFLSRGYRGTPWQIYFENLDNYQLNIDFFKSFLGFQGRNFLILYILIFLSWSKKKIEVSQLLGGEGVRTQVVKFHNFFFEWILP